MHSITSHHNRVFNKSNDKLDYLQVCKWMWFQAIVELRCAVGGFPIWIDVKTSQMFQRNLIWKYSRNEETQKKGKKKKFQANAPRTLLIEINMLILFQSSFVHHFHGVWSCDELEWHMEDLLCLKNFLGFLNCTSRNSSCATLCLPVFGVSHNYKVMQLQLARLTLNRFSFSLSNVSWEILGRIILRKPQPDSSICEGTIFHFCACYAFVNHQLSPGARCKLFDISQQVGQDIFLQTFV